MNTQGQRLRWARKRADLSQEALAKIVGVKQRTISMIERDETENTRHIIAIASAVGVNPHWLETGKGQRDAISWAEVMDLSKLPPDARADAKRLFDSVADGDLPPARFRAAVIALLGDDLDG